MPCPVGFMFYERRKNASATQPIYLFILKLVSFKHMYFDYFGNLL